jgi:hypothetical protein
MGTLLRIVLAAGALTACPGDLRDPARFQQTAAAPSCPDVVATVFTPRCALSGCHASAAMSGSLDLQSPDIYQRLVGKAAAGGPGVLIDPGDDPNRSVLYLKMTTEPPFGGQMPLGGDKLDAATLACVGAWVLAGGQTTDAGVTDGGPGESASPEPPQDAATSTDSAPDGAPASGGPDSGALADAGTDV